MKIMILAGGFDQIELIKNFKKRNHYIVLVDYLKNPPAIEFADKTYCVSTLDENAVYNIALFEKIDLIITACTDQALLTVAIVSEKLNLPCYIDTQTAINVTNKSHMKTIFKDNGILTAEFIVLENEDYEKLFSNRIINRFPLIVKPCDCNSSKGIKKAHNVDELLVAVKEAFLLSRNKKVIVEEYIEGDEVSIDVWLDSEGAKVLSISGTNKIASNDDMFTIFQSRYPINLGIKDEKEIQILVSKIAKAFNLNNCPMLVQALINETGIYIIEFSARMGGGSKYKLIEYMSNVQIMEVFVNRVLGDEKQIINPQKSSKYLELNYLYANNGIYNTLTGFEPFLKNNVVKELFEYKNPGALIEKHITSSDRIAGFIIEENSEEELIKVRNDVLNSIDILNIKGESIFYRECFI